MTFCGIYLSSFSDFDSDFFFDENWLRDLMHPALQEVYAKMAVKVV